MKRWTDLNTEYQNIKGSNSDCIRSHCCLVIPRMFIILYGLWGPLNKTIIEGPKHYCSRLIPSAWSFPLLLLCSCSGVDMCISACERLCLVWTYYKTLDMPSGVWHTNCARIACVSVSVNVSDTGKEVYLKYKGSIVRIYSAGDNSCSICGFIPFLVKIFILAFRLKDIKHLLMWCNYRETNLVENLLVLTNSLYFIIG